MASIASASETPVRAEESVSSSHETLDKKSVIPEADSAAPVSDGAVSAAETGTEQASLLEYVDDVARAPEGVRYTGTPRSDSIGANKDRPTLAGLAVIASAVTKFLAARQLEHFLEPWNINRIALESQIEEQRKSQLLRSGDTASASAALGVHSEASRAATQHT